MEKQLLIAMLGDVIDLAREIKCPTCRDKEPCCTLPCIHWDDAIEALHHALIEMKHSVNEEKKAEKNRS